MEPVPAEHSARALRDKYDPSEIAKLSNFVEIPCRNLTATLHLLAIVMKHLKIDRYSSRITLPTL